MADQKTKSQKAIAALEKAIAQRDREMECLRLRRQGMEYEAIAEIVGYAGGSGVKAAIDRALARPVDAEAAMFRLSEEEKLDRWEAELEKLAKGTYYASSFGTLLEYNGKPIIDIATNLRARDILIKLAARRAALRGGDAPQKKVIYDLTNDVVEAEIARISALSAQMKAEIAAEQG